MIEIKDDERFERDGDNLIMDLPLSFSQAALGHSVTVPTPYGDERISIPAGTQGGTILKLKGKETEVVVYRVTETEVRITRVWHGRQSRGRN